MSDDTKIADDKAADDKTAKAAKVAKDSDGNPITAFASYDEAAAQAKALGGKHRVDAIGTAFAVVSDSE